MVKKQWLLGLILLLLIPLVLMLGGMLFSHINPEIAAGHPNYVRNFHLLHSLQNTLMWATAAIVVVLWLMVCFLVIRSKNRSTLWLLLALFGPLGFAVLATLNDRAPMETDRYDQFVRSLNILVRVGYELCTFAIVWMLAYGGMVAKRGLMIAYQAATSGLSSAQIIDSQNASGGMWAFAEGTEVLYLVVLLYLLRPIVFSFVGKTAATMVFSKAR
jgi:hypothetical protein